MFSQPGNAGLKYVYDMFLNMQHLHQYFL